MRTTDNLRALSRNSDPWTSHAAGASVNVKSQCEAILTVLRVLQYAGAEEIAEQCGLDAYAVRKRLADLHDARLAKPSEVTRKTRSGRAERIWMVNT